MARTPTPIGAAIAAFPAAAAAATPAADAAPANEQPNTDEPPEDAGELVEVRVLLAFDEHEPNDVATIPAAALAALKDSGHIDDHGDAIAYAKSLIA